MAASGAPPTRRCLERIQRELRALSHEPLPGILLSPDASDLCLLRALIVGPEDTPYAGGCFQFEIRFPASYPSCPPTLRFLTTDNGRVAFGPQLPSSGVVCPSLYGPWPESQWTRAPSLCGLLLTLQSLFNSNPLADQSVSQALAEEYKAYIHHETIRVAVCDALEGCSGSDFPGNFQRAIHSSFEFMFDRHVAACDSHATSGLTLTTALRELAGFVSSNFRYLEPFPKLKQRLKALRAQLESGEGPPPPEEEAWFETWRQRRSLVELDRGKENARPKLHVRRSLDAPMRGASARRSAPPSSGKSFEL